MPDTVFHGGMQPENGIHGIRAIDVANAAGRLSLPWGESDVGRCARQTDTNDIWCMVNHAPRTWRNVTAGAGLAPSGPHASDGAVGIGEMRLVDATAASRAWLLPGTADAPANGNLCAVKVVGIADGHTVSVAPGTGVSLENGADTLSVDGEVKVWVYDTASATWRLCSDGGILPASASNDGSMSAAHFSKLSELPDNTTLQADLSAKAAGSALTEHTENVSNPHSVTASQVGAVPVERTVSTTAPLTGGGELSANLTLGIAAATPGVAGSMSGADKTAHDAIARGFRGVYAITGTTHTPVLDDAGRLGMYAGSVDCVVTLPLNSSVAYSLGAVLPLEQTSIGALVIAGADGVSVTPEHGFSLRSAGPGARLFAVKTSANAWSVSGGLAEALPDGQVLYEQGFVTTTTEVGYQPIAEIPASQLLPRQTWDMAVSVIAQAEGGARKTFDFRFSFFTDEFGDVGSTVSDSPLQLWSWEAFDVDTDIKSGVLTLIGQHPESQEDNEVTWSVRIAGHGLTHGYADPPA